MITRKRVERYLRMLHARRHKLLSARRTLRADARMSNGRIALLDRELNAVCAEIDLWEMWEYRIWPGPHFERQRVAIAALIEAL